MFSECGPIQPLTADVVGGGVGCLKRKLNMLLSDDGGLLTSSGLKLVNSVGVGPNASIARSLWLTQRRSKNRYPFICPH